MRQRVRGLPTLRQATFRTLRRPEVRRRLWAASGSIIISFVSYFSFANKRLETSKVNSYLVALYKYDTFCPII